jgi:uncharacterized SAM-binding protein YcdF (DUF218 family)
MSEAVGKRETSRAAAAQGAVLGLLLTSVLLQLKMDAAFAPGALVLGATAGTALGVSRCRWLLWWGGGIAGALVLVVACTPLVPWLVRGTDTTDEAVPSDAAVVLGCGVLSDGTPTSTAEDRLLHGAELVRNGEAHTVVLCGALWTPRIRQQLRDWGVHVPVVWSGPVGNTHDEALATARLAREHGWKRVIVVTQAWHMPRAAAVFRSTGLDVLRSPAAETRYDLADPSLLSDRLQALRDWSHEKIGLWVYGTRGWIR